MATDKKAPRHKRLYSDSPKMERDESGSMKAVKPSQKKGPTEAEKESKEVQSGTDGMKVTEAESARIQEIKDMHSRHQKEMESIHKRHQKDDVKKYEKTEHDGDNNESAGAGEKEVSEIDKTKEITE